MTIKEVAEKYNLTEATLRYYEQIGIINNVPRKNGIRNYSEENLKAIEFIVCMRSSGMSIERLKKYMELFKKPNTSMERQQILEEQKREVEEQIKVLNNSLEKLNYKIELYKKGKM